jgi:hypothetical protein
MRFSLDLLRNAHDELVIYINYDKLKIGEFFTINDAIIFLKAKLENIEQNKR